MNDLRPDMFDPEFLLEHIRRDTKFDADLLEKIIAEWKRYKATGLEPEEISDIIKLCGDYNKAGLDARFVQACIDVAESGLTTDRLRNLLSAEKDGRLVVLPCKVGDSGVWVHNGTMTPVHVHRIQINKRGTFLVLKSTVVHGAFPVDQIGKTVFLANEEAEAALGKERERPLEEDGK